MWGVMLMRFEFKLIFQFSQCPIEIFSVRYFFFIEIECFVFANSWSKQLSADNYIIELSLYILHCLLFVVFFFYNYLSLIYKSISISANKWTTNICVTLFSELILIVMQINSQYKYSFCCLLLKIIFRIHKKYLF